MLSGSINNRFVLPGKIKVICIRQNTGRLPQPVLGEIYDAEIIPVDTPGRATEYMYKINKFLCSYSNHWVIPLRDYNLNLLVI